MWHGSREAWLVVFQQTIPGLTISGAEAISLEGITILAVEVDWLRAPVSKVVAVMVEDEGKAGSASQSSEDWELALEESVGVLESLCIFLVTYTQVFIALDKFVHVKSYFVEPFSLTTSMSMVIIMTLIAMIIHITYICVQQRNANITTLMTVRPELRNASQHLKDCANHIDCQFLDATNFHVYFLWYHG
uniref:Gustatory receptor n=1 Tax=Romanomermis culicivorax TaxID=13658 RepID=A0A915K063_ROMCU